MAFIVAAALLPAGAWGVYAAAALLLLAVTVAARLSPWLVVRRSLVDLPFLLAAVTLLFTVPGRVVSGQAVWAGMTDAGLARFLGIVARPAVAGRGSCC